MSRQFRIHTVHEPNELNKVLKISKNIVCMHIELGSQIASAR